MSPWKTETGERNNKRRKKLIGKLPSLAAIAENGDMLMIPSDKYYEYLAPLNQENVLHDIVFREKGEMYFPSIALASNIARYSFLVYMNDLGKKYGCKIPLGAGKDVNDFATKFIDKFGIDEFNKIVKKNFKNYNEVTAKGKSLI